MLVTRIPQTNQRQKIGFGASYTKVSNLLHNSKLQEGNPLKKLITRELKRGDVLGAYETIFNTNIVVEQVALTGEIKNKPYQHIQDLMELTYDISGETKKFFNLAGKIADKYNNQQKISNNEYKMLTEISSLLNKPKV